MSKDEPHKVVDETEEKDKTDGEMVIEFIQKYRSKMGLPELDDYKDKSIKGALGPGVRLYRYLAPGRQFAICDDEKIKDALVEAGAIRVIPFTMSPDSTKVHYDITLPGFFWSYL
jgi:hypothetical protein